MSLRDEIDSKYTDEDGLILEKPNSSPGPETGNGITNLSVYMMLLHLSGDLTGKDVISFNSAITSCQVPYSSSIGLFVERGLFNRGPRKIGDLIGHDDYVSLSGASNIIGSPFCRDIAIRGSSCFWNFNNIDPNKFTFKSWQGRFFFSFVPFWKLMGGFPIMSLEAFLMCKYLEMSSADAGSSILQWIMCRALMGRGGQFDRSVIIWRSNLFHRFPEGMRSVFANYYNPTHPFAKYAPVF